jgi:hypothetical protein
MNVFGFLKQGNDAGRTAADFSEVELLPIAAFELALT